MEPGQEPSEGLPPKLELLVALVALTVLLELRVVAAAALYVVVLNEHECTKSRATITY